ncbi:MAG: hypothetical protein SOW08_00215 [Lachnospiraceae bacterium]|nr:hypothetical protein [Lachnospiraceae bacterium]
MNMHVNRQFKDSLFRMLFNNKEALLSLYNAINSSDYQDPEDLEITTINDVIYMGIKNDVSFLIGSDMNLYEAQSTGNPNMPLRGLIYLAHLYEGYVSKNKLNLYGTRMISLPTPRYIVLYSGIRKEPDYKEYHLTDSFADKDSSCLECTAVVLNVNTGHNQKILAQCQLLNEYACFLETVRNYTDEPSYTMNEAIDLAVTECIRKGILSDLLSKHRAEVINVLLTEYDADLHMKATYEEGFLEGRQAGLAEGRQAGIAEGRQAGIQILISSNKKNGISKETTVHDLILNFSLSESQASEYMNQYW